MARSSFASGSVYLGYGGGGRGGSLRAGSVHGGAGGHGVLISQASRPLLVGPSRLVGGGLGSGVGLGTGLGVGLGTGLGSGLGLGLGSGLGVGLGSGIGASSATVLGASSAAGFGFGSAGGFGSGAAFKVGPGFGGIIGGADVGILGNEKFTMRVLNDRLASYLKKVHLLEKANAELELKIRQFVDSRTSPIARDYTDSLSTINELQAEILDAIQVRGTVQLNIDNVTLAADDFRIKYENELSIRQAVEADIAGLKRLLDDIHLGMAELTLQIDTLNDEKAFIKKNHDEEMVTTRSQMSGQIHVEVEAAPQQDLTSVLEDIRDHYETIAAKNRRELEGWFKGKLETLRQEVATGTQTIATSHTEMSTEKTKVQGLELELQSVLAVKASLGAKLLETQAFYAAHLSGYQLQVTSLEEQLLQLRANLDRQGRDYQMLLDIKTRLEVEIAEYRRLLEIGALGIALDITGRSSPSAAPSAAPTGVLLQQPKEKADPIPVE
ncbi:keratin, type I cytoskeletal 50 kDa [Pangasianodon hypophthalmus]|uniref:keratin, type I cytoskeletal 50 kDa n=1 Tax=Pangasianodon hypophthalmus TaxID=310915 RepID=UPI002306E6C4|nr:keratin, type I cytoskeletal 50 kDa [Pangasianodon hypophthalmus]